LSKFEPTLHPDRRYKGEPNRSPRIGWIGRRCNELRNLMANDWSRQFDEPIELPDGQMLATLRNAGDYITKLPKAVHSAPEWQSAMEALILVATLGGPTMFARIGMMRALNRHRERVFNPDRKDHYWGKRKLKRGPGLMKPVPPRVVSAYLLFRVGWQRPPTQLGPASKGSPASRVSLFQLRMRNLSQSWVFDTLARGSPERQRGRPIMSMFRTPRVPIAAILVGLLLSTPAFAQAHIRGTLTDAKDGTISVQTAKGEMKSIKLVNDTDLFLVTKADMSAIQSGKFVGVTSVEQEGKRVAREVHVFDDSLRGLAEGHYPWDLDSKPNMMTNANIAKVDEVGTDRVLKLDYKGGEQTIAIPTSAAVVAFNKAPADQLASGRMVFVVMKNDSSEAAAVVIGAEGVKPPM
jgi:hypothetical protein